MYFCSCRRHDVLDVLCCATSASKGLIKGLRNLGVTQPLLVLIIIGLVWLGNTFVSLEFKRHTDESEVHLQQTVAVDQQISRFDVPVQDPGRVQVLQP